MKKEGFRHEMIDLPDSLSVFAFISMLMFVPLLLFCVGTSLKSKIYVSLVSIKKKQTKKTRIVYHR